MNDKNINNNRVLERLSHPLGHGMISPTQRLQAPSGQVREAIFNLIEHHKPWSPQRRGA